MAKKATIKKTAPSFSIPQNEKEVNRNIERIGEIQRQEQVLKGDMDAALLRLKKSWAERFEKLKDEREALSNGVHMWCETNRIKLTNNGRTKTHKFMAGLINWRKRPAKVTLRGVEDILKALVKAKKKQFIRTKTEVDKEAMLADPAAAEKFKGVSIGSDGEYFVITPNETEIEEMTS